MKTPPHPEIRPRLLGKPPPGRTSEALRSLTGRQGGLPRSRPLAAGLGVWERSGSVGCEEEARRVGPARVLPSRACGGRTLGDPAPSLARRGPGSRWGAREGGLRGAGRGPCALRPLPGTRGAPGALRARAVRSGDPTVERGPRGAGASEQSAGPRRGREHRPGGSPHTGRLGAGNGGHGPGRAGVQGSPWHALEAGCARTSPGPRRRVPAAAGRTDGRTRRGCQREAGDRAGGGRPGAGRRASGPPRSAARKRRTSWRGRGLGGPDAGGSSEAPPASVSPQARPRTASARPGRSGLRRTRTRPGTPPPGHRAAARAHAAR